MGPVVVAAAVVLRGAPVLRLGAVSVALLAGFVVRQTRAGNPLVPLSLFRSRTVSGANLVQVTMTIGLFGFNFLGALYLQRVLGYTPVGASFAFLPIAVVLAVVSLGLAARLNMRFGPRNVLLAGLALIGVALLLAARAPVDAVITQYVEGQRTTPAGAFHPSVH